MRIGHGYDVHAFGPVQPDNQKALVLGGVTIPYERALIAHSDGDVLIHALCDALLGAAALGDIGAHFPDTDPQYKNVDSRELLRQVVTLIAEKGYFLTNADITLVAEAPKMAPYIGAMVSHLAADMNCNIDQVNVKATTTEKLGYVGRGEGIACHALVLLHRQ